MELCHREVKPYWWCIGRECRHEIEIPYGPNMTKEIICIHPNILAQEKADKIKGIGYPVKQMTMCPVLAPRIEI